MTEVLVFLFIIAFWSAVTALLIRYVVDPLFKLAFWWVVAKKYGREFADEARRKLEEKS